MTRWRLECGFSWYYEAMKKEGLLAGVLVVLVLCAGFAMNRPAFASYSFGKNLSVGAMGADVRALQQILIDRGFLLGVALPTGYFGPATRAALVKLQMANGIAPASGYAGPITRTFLNALGAVPPVASSTSAATTSTTQLLATSSVSSTPSIATQPIDITKKSIVGLWCYFNVATGSLLSMYGSDPLVFQSTGVIVNPDGYILTAKHVVDQAWVGATYGSSSPTSTQQIYASMIFDHCDVGVPKTDYLPSPQEIKDWNPSELLGPMRYHAKLFFEPKTIGLSDEESQDTDFSILKIDGIADGCSTWYSDCSSTAPFPYSPVMYASTPSVGNQLLSYGYPVEASVDYEDQLYFKGAVGRLSEYDNGDAYFKNTPFTIHWAADGVRGGRSGSPVFWNGFVSGILYARSTETEDVKILGMPAIEKMLQDNGLGNILKTN